MTPSWMKVAAFVIERSSRQNSEVWNIRHWKDADAYTLKSGYLFSTAKATVIAQMTKQPNAALNGHGKQAGTVSLAEWFYYDTSTFATLLKWHNYEWVLDEDEENVYCLQMVYCMPIAKCKVMGNGVWNLYISDHVKEAFLIDHVVVTIVNYLAKTWLSSI